MSMSSVSLSILPRQVLEHALSIHLINDCKVLWARQLLKLRLHKVHSCGSDRLHRKPSRKVNSNILRTSLSSLATPS